MKWFPSFLQGLAQGRAASVASGLILLLDNECPRTSHEALVSTLLYMYILYGCVCIYIYTHVCERTICHTLIAIAVIKNNKKDNSKNGKKRNNNNTKTVALIVEITINNSKHDNHHRNVCIHVYMFMFVYVYTYIHIHIYIYIYI